MAIDLRGETDETFFEMNPGVIKIRDVDFSERIYCQVGGGECMMMACEMHDNGIGGTFAVCRFHLKHVYHFTSLIMNLDLEKFDRLGAEIDQVETQTKN